MHINIYIYMYYIYTFNEIYNNFYILRHDLHSLVGKKGWATRKSQAKHPSFGGNISVQV